MAVAPTKTRSGLGPLRPLLPYALRYKGRIGAGVVALGLASAATLALPIAARRVIDHGFSDGNGGLIDAYFAVLIAVVATIAISASTAPKSAVSQSCTTTP